MMTNSMKCFIWVVVCSTLIALVSSEVVFRKRGAADCGVCRSVVTELKRANIDFSTTEDIQSAVNKVCALFPPSKEGACDTYVQQYSSGIVDLAYDMYGIPSPRMCRAVFRLC